MSVVYYHECWDWINSQSPATLNALYNEHNNKDTWEVIDTPWGKREHRGDVLEHLRPIRV